jgi:hypothetical protein
MGALVGFYSLFQASGRSGFLTAWPGQGRSCSLLLGTWLSEQYRSRGHSQDRKQQTYCGLGSLHLSTRRHACVYASGPRGSLQRRFSCRSRQGNKDVLSTKYRQEVGVSFTVQHQRWRSEEEIGRLVPEQLELDSARIATDIGTNTHSRKRPTQSPLQPRRLSRPKKPRQW